MADEFHRGVQVLKKMTLPGEEERLINRLRRLFLDDNQGVGDFLWRVSRGGRLCAGSSPQLWPYMCLAQSGYTVEDLLQLLQDAPQRAEDQGTLPAWTRGLFQLVQQVQDKEALASMPAQVDPAQRCAVEWALAEAGVLGKGQLSQETLERAARSACVALLVPTCADAVWGEQVWGQALRRATLGQREDVLLSNQILPALLPALTAQEILEVAPRVNLKAWPQVVELAGDKLGEVADGLLEAWTQEKRSARDGFWLHLVLAAHHLSGAAIPAVAWPRVKENLLRPGADLSCVVRWSAALSPEQRQDLITGALSHARVEVRREAVSLLKDQPHDEQVASWLKPRLKQERSSDLKKQIKSLLARS